jgi:hypothetical protein
MSDYLAGTRPGAHLYNLTHATVLPAVIRGAGYRQADRLVMALALVWLAHIGLDRLLGIGLKHNDRFPHTPSRRRSRRQEPGPRPLTVSIRFVDQAWTTR